MCDISDDSKRVAHESIVKWIAHLKPKKFVAKVQPYHCYFDGYQMIDAFKPAGSRATNS